MLGFGWESAPPETLRELKNQSEGVGKELGKAFGSQDAHDQAYLTKLKRSESEKLQKPLVFIWFLRVARDSDTPRLTYLPRTNLIPPEIRLRGDGLLSKT